MQSCCLASSLFCKAETVYFLILKKCCVVVFLPFTLFYFEMQHRKCLCWSLLTSQLKAAAGNWSVCTFSSVEVTSVDTRHHQLWLLPLLPLPLLLFSLLMELMNHSEPVDRTKKSQVEFKWILEWSPVIVWVSPVGTSEVSFYLRSKKRWKFGSLSPCVSLRVRSRWVSVLQCLHKTEY